MIISVAAVSKAHHIPHQSNPINMNKCLFRVVADKMDIVARSASYV